MNKKFGRIGINLLTDNEFNVPKVHMCFVIYVYILYPKKGVFRTDHQIKSGRVKGDD